MTKCGKCLCSGIKWRNGEVSVKEDREEKRGEEKERGALETVEDE